MAPIGQVLGHELFSKTKMCRFHRMGKCAKGMQCPWAHDESELKETPDLRRTKLCKDLIAKGRCTRANCNFAHSRAECRSVVHDADGVTFSADLSGWNSTRAVESSTSKNDKVGQTRAVDVPEFMPVNFNVYAPEFIPGKNASEAPAFVPMPSASPEVRVDAPEFIPELFASEVPAFVPMPSLPPGLPAPPPGLEDYTSYSPCWGYPSSSQEESESDCSSYEDIKTEDIKLDGNTPIAEILAMFSQPKQTSPNPQMSAAKKLASVSTAGSLVDLQLFPEEQKMSTSSPIMAP